MEVFLCGVVIAVITFILGQRAAGWKHRRRIQAADRVLARIAGINEPAARLAYLRKVDPFVFEELVLTALCSRGYKIKRNKRYTGDGGIDGKFWFNGHQFWIQAKRYSGHINAGHVDTFNSLCKENGVYGLFVHTGRTGEQAKSGHYSSIIMLSGDRLLQLVGSQQPVKVVLNDQFYVTL